MHYIQAKSLLTKWNSMNLYRGCTHGCIYCDSRSTCYHFDHIFEDIEVKENAPELLESILKKKRKKCMISTGSMSDPYMPIEKELQLTRKCLQIIEKYGFGGTVITKSDLILRDIDIIRKIHQKNKFVVQMTLTTADEALCQKLEPHVCTTKRRVEALKEFSKNEIPTVVWFSPILPFINDTQENLNSIIDVCCEAGVKGILFFGAGMTLREGDREYFYAKLDELFPGLQEKYRKKYGNAYHVISEHNQELTEIFQKRCLENNIISDVDECFRYINTLEENANQLILF